MYLQMKSIHVITHKQQQDKLLFCLSWATNAYM